MAVVYCSASTPPGVHTASQFIATIPLVFVAPRERHMPRVVDLATVATEGWVLNPEGCGFRSVVQELLDGIDAPLQVAVEAHGVDLQLAIVARGVGVSLVPELLLQRSRVRSQVQAFRIHGYDCRIGVWLVSGRLSAMFTPVVAMLHAQLTRVLR
jgi:DNA-binding transcriptional LysR family regulator